jgi:geranylgeranyl transferase type-2 subunit beta
MSFYGEQHLKYLGGLEALQNTVEFVASEHLRMSGLYWRTMALHMLGGDAALAPSKEGILSFIASCRHPDGGYSGNVGHDPHLLYTLSALQLLTIYGSLDELSAEEKEKTARWVASLQQEDGSITGDKWGEVDTRFSYCALQSLALLKRLDAIDVKKAIDFVLSCGNFDGGFGAVPGGESHAGQVFCCLGALAIGGALDRIDADLLGWWLAERQCDSGGLNGRPEKQADVCYSWWILSSLAMLKKTDWIDRKALTGFIVACQDKDDGGISDRPGNMGDVYHTYFGIAGLSLLGYSTAKFGTLQPAEGEEDKARAIDPVYALPAGVSAKLGLPGAMPGAIPAAAAKSTD